MNLRRTKYRVSAVGVCVAAALGYWSLAQAGIIGSAPLNGVAINAKGELTLRQADDPTGRLLRQRVVEARASLNKDLAKRSKLRKVSLQRLEAALQQRLEAGEKASDDMLNLAGLTRVSYVFYYPETKDIVIAGPAEGYVDDTSGRTIGIETGHATVKLEDLVVALRAYAPGTRGVNLIGCSIDPTQQGLVAMQRTVAAAHRQWRTRPNSAQIRNFVEAMRKALGPQTIRVLGISPKTHFAAVLVEADYRMKLLGIGLERPPKGVKLTSYVSKATARSVARNALQRWYFVPDYKCVRVSEDKLAMELVGDGVKLVGEDEVVNQGGQRTVSGRRSYASGVFVNSFTKAYPKLAIKSPVYAQLRTVIDVAIAAAFIQQQDFHGKSGWKMSVLGSEERFPVELYNAPKQVMPAATAIWKGKTLMTPIGGGVSVEARRALETSNQQQDTGGKVAKLREAISLKDLPQGTWWWD